MVQSKKNISLNFKVGIFILAGVLCVFAYVVLIGGNKTYFNLVSKYKMEFETVDGLFVGSSVKVNGIPVGNVSDIRFLPKIGNVQVVVSVLRKFTTFVTDQSVASLGTKGLLGDKYISIITKGKTGQKLAQNSYIPTQPVSGILGALGREATGEKLALILDELLILTRSLNSEKTIKHLTKTVQDISLMFSEKKSKELSQSLKKLNSILTKIDEGEGTAGALINNKNLYNRLLGLLGQRPYHKYLPALADEEKH